MQRPGELDQYKKLYLRWARCRLGGRVGSAHTTAANKGAEDLRPHWLREDCVHQLPLSLTATMSMLHLLTSHSGRDSAGSVTTGEERDRVDTVILFRYGEGERARREKPYQTRGYIYNVVKKSLHSSGIKYNTRVPRKKKRKLADNFLSYQERKLDQKHAPASRS